MERLIALDTETTGLEISEGHRIIEVAGVEIIEGEKTGNEWLLKSTANGPKKFKI